MSDGRYHPPTEQQRQEVKDLADRYNFESSWELTPDPKPEQGNENQNR